MSTRAVIARAGKREGEFSGVYHHSDGYPTGLGAYLWELLHGYFKNNLSKMLHVLIDEHPAGWSSIVNKDFKLKPGYTNMADRPKGMSFEQFNNLPLNRRPHCYCHGDRSEDPCVFTQDDLKEKDTDIEWAYIFDEENNKMHIRDLWGKEELTVDLTEPEPDWDIIACGEDFSRCKHMASYHGIDSPLGMQTYLGKRPLDFMRDAVAYVINGRRYEATGNGGNSTYLRKGPPDAWIATLINDKGVHVDKPIAQLIDGEYKPYPGVTPIYPKIKLDT